MSQRLDTIGSSWKRRVPIIAFFLLSVAPGVASARVVAEIPDAWITANTKMALLTSRDVHVNAVHVDTVEGRVTLHGKVTTSDERRAAEQISRGLLGVKAVQNLLQVVPPAKEKLVERADQGILENATQALQQERSLVESHIVVKSVNQGVVLLGGKAATLTDHLRAVECVAELPGVRRVATEVSSPAELSEERIWERKREALDAARDVRITAATKLRLFADPVVPAPQISVDTSRGVVSLFGVVPSEEAKTAAALDARNVDDVIDVRNELVVEPLVSQIQGDTRDVELRDNVHAALARHPEFRRVDVTVTNGIARLTGSVANRWQHLRVAIVARSISGVRAVENELRVVRAHASRI